MELSLDTANFLLFGLSGFITVWTFRHFSKSERGGEFEYIGLSFFWGIAILFLAHWISYRDPRSAEAFDKILGFPFAAGFAFSAYGFAVGLIGSKIARAKWFKKTVQWIDDIC